MTDSLSERVLLEIERRANQIDVSDADLGCSSLTVLRARRSLGESELPAVVIWEDGETVDSGSGSSASMTVSLQVTVEAHVVANSETTGISLSTVKALVKAALCIGNGAIGDDDGAIGTLTYVSAEAVPRPDGAASEAIALRFTAKFKEAYGDPTRSK